MKNWVALYRFACRQFSCLKRWKSEATDCAWIANVYNLWPLIDLILMVDMNTSLKVTCRCRCTKRTDGCGRRWVPSRKCTVWIYTLTKRYTLFGLCVCVLSRTGRRLCFPVQRSVKFALWGVGSVVTRMCLWHSSLNGIIRIIYDDDDEEEHAHTRSLSLTHTHEGGETGVSREQQV